MEQAIEKGYTHFIEEDGTRLEKFSEVNDENRKYYDKVYFVVDMETPMHYQLSADEIKDIITDHVGEQTEFGDEDGKLCDVVSDADFTALANELNQKFKAHKFYMPLEIQVTFQPHLTT